MRGGRAGAACPGPPHSLCMNRKKDFTAPPSRLTVSRGSGQGNRFARIETRVRGLFDLFAVDSFRAD